MSKNAVEKFSEYMHKLNLKWNIYVFSVFYLHFCSGCLICEQISSFKSCGVVRDVVVSENSYYM